MQNMPSKLRNKFLAGLMVTVLALPAQAFAQTANCPTGTTDPTCPNSVNNTAFAAQKTAVTSSSNTSVQLPNYNTAGTPSGTTSQPLYTLNDAQHEPNLPSSCNPVVWTQLMQQYQQQVLQEAAIANGMHSRSVAALNNGCTTNASGQTRQNTLQQIENGLQNSIEGAICSLNWSSLLGFNFDVSLGLCKNGKLFSANATANGNSQFNINGQNPLNPTSGCVNAGSVNSNTMQNALALTKQTTGGVNGNGSGASSINISSVPVPTTGSGSGITLFNIGGSTNTNSNGSGSPVAGSTSSTSSTTTSNAPPTPATPPPAPQTPVTPPSPPSSNPLLSLFK